MIKEFMKYVSEYDKKKEEVISKIDHSLRVHEMMLSFAGELKFTEEEVKLAGIVGLLHDIGRFEQIKMTDSFNDLKGFDHAEVGADILFGDGLIEKFCKEERYYPVIEYAIREHNKLKMKPTEDDLSLRMGKLIRDVDKIDILYILGVLGEYDRRDDGSEIKKQVLDFFDKNECVDNKFVETNNEDLAATFALVFDINYDMSLKLVRKNVAALYDRVGKKGTFDEIYKKAIKHLDERIG